MRSNAFFCGVTWLIEIRELFSLTTLQIIAFPYFTVKISIVSQEPRVGSKFGFRENNPRFVYNVSVKNRVRFGKVEGVKED